MKSAKQVDLVRRFALEEPERNDRIQDEIIVDTYDDEEVTSSWYYYLEEMLNFPFDAMVQTHKKRYAGSGIAYCSSQMRVLGLAPLQRCGVNQIWAMAILSVSSGETPIHILLTDIVSVEPDAARQEALTDWQYWNRKLDFGWWELK